MTGTSRTAPHAAVEYFPYEIKGGAQARRRASRPARRETYGRRAGGRRAAHRRRPRVSREDDDGSRGRVMRLTCVRSSPPRCPSFSRPPRLPKGASGVADAMGYAHP